MVIAAARARQHPQRRAAAPAPTAATASTTASTTATTTSSPPDGIAGGVVSGVAQMRMELLRIEFELRVLRLDVGRSELAPRRAALRRGDARLADAKAQVARARNRAERDAANERCVAFKERVRGLRREVEAEARSVERDAARARALEVQLGSAAATTAATADGAAPRWIDFSPEELLAEPLHAAPLLAESM